VAGPGRAELAAALGRRPLQMVSQSAGIARRCAPTQMSIRSVASVRAVRTNLPRKRSRGLRGGIFTAWIPASARTTSNDAVNCQARCAAGSLPRGTPAEQQLADSLGHVCPVEFVGQQDMGEISPRGRGRGDAFKGSIDDLITHLNAGPAAAVSLDEVLIGAGRRTDFLDGAAAASM
jgi:hypothetical protein